MTNATSNFLIPNATLIVELVCFLIVLAFLGRIVLPPLNKVLKERATQIQGDLEAADEAKADAAEADEERRRALEEARQHAREIVEQANRTAEQVAADAQARGQVEYDRLLAAAERDVALARQRAIEEASGRLSEVVIGLVSQILGREVDAEAHRDLINEAVAAISSEDVAGTGSRP